MQLLLLAVTLVVSAPTPSDVADVSEADNSVSFIREVDLDSGDSPLFAIEPASGSNLAAGIDLGIRSPERLFRTAPYLRVNDQNKVQLRMPRGGLITVGHVADAGKGNVALCRGWINEAWCEVSMQVDELRNTATLQVTIPRRDGSLRVTFKQTHKSPAVD